MELHYPRWIWLVVPAFLTGCGGDSGNRASDLPVAVKSVEYLDAETQEVTHRIEFDYQLPRRIDSYYQTPGVDGRWGNADDIRTPYLTCLYEEDDSALPYQRFLAQAAFKRSPSGAAAVAAINLIDGEATLCPAVEGHYLEHEGYCTGDHCPGSSPTDTAGYALMISRYRQNDMIIENQTFLPVHGGSAQFTISQTQETRIILDDLGRVTDVAIDTVKTNFLDDILADICADGPSLAIALLLYRSCHAMKESAHYTYDEENIFREANYYHGWNFSFVSEQQRIIDEEAGTLTVTTRGAFTDPDADQDEYVFSFNGNRKVTGMTIHRPGEDGILHTEDDLIRVPENYFYNENGQPSRVERASGVTERYFYNAFGQQYMIETLSETMLPDQVVQFQYKGGQLASSLLARVPPDGPQQLVSISKTYYRTAPAYLTSDFSPATPGRFDLPTLDSVLTRFDLP